MAVPKKKKTRAARDERRSHHALSKMALTACPECGFMNPPHRVCKNCGSYRGRKMVGSGVAAALQKTEAKKETKKATEKKSEKKSK
jgi:large subunit ribosomal protein L32